MKLPIFLFLSLILSANGIASNSYQPGKEVASFPAIASSSGNSHHTPAKKPSAASITDSTADADLVSGDNLHLLYSEFITASYLEDMNQNDKAGETYLNALKYAPRSPFLLSQASNALLRTGKIAEAIAIAEKAIKECTQAADLYEVLGRAYLANQEWEKATQTFEKALIDKPHSIQLLTDLSLLYIRDNRFEPAINLFRKMAAIDPSQAVLYNYKAAALLFQINRFEEALAEYQDIIKKYPQFYEAYMQIGIIYELKEEQDKAIETYTNALRIVKNRDEEVEIHYKLGALYQTQKAYSEALNHFNRIKEVDENELKAWKATLSVYITQGDYAKALEEGIELGKKTPGDFRIHLLLLEIYAKQNQEEEGYKQFLVSFDEAIRNNLESDCLSYLYEVTQSPFVEKSDSFHLTEQVKQLLFQCTSRHPKFIRNYFAQSAFGLATHDKSMVLDGLNAIVASLESIKENKDQKKLDAICFDYLVWYKVRSSFINQGLIDKFESALTLCKSLYPDDIELLRTLSQTAIDQKKWESALEQLKNIQKQIEDDSPYCRETLLQTALVYDKLNQLDSLETLLRDAMKQYPSDAQFFNFLGYTYAERNIKLDEARTLVEKAQTLDPGDGNILDSLGWVYYRLGRFNDAIVQLEQAAELEKNHPVIMDHLGDAYLRKGQSEKAISYWKKSLQYGPEFPFEFTPEFEGRLDQKIKEAEKPKEAVMEFFSKDEIESLQSILTEDRYLHSYNVCKTALHIGKAWEKQYPVDHKKLAWAALFHDCGKDLSPEEKKGLLNDGPLFFGKELVEKKKLLHAPLGAKILSLRYGINDPDVLMTVAYHPTGHPDFPHIGWIVYASDSLEPGRVYFEERENILDSICKNPIEGLRSITRLKIESVIERGKTVHPLAEKVHKFLQKSKHL